MIVFKEGYRIQNTMITEDMLAWEDARIPKSTTTNTASAKAHKGFDIHNTAR